MIGTPPVSPLFFSPAASDVYKGRVGSMTAWCAGREEGRGVVCVLPGPRAQQVAVEVSRDGGERLVSPIQI